MNGAHLLNTDLRYLTDLSWGYRSARVLQLTNKLDIFTILSKGEMSTEQLVKVCSAKLF